MPRPPAKVGQSQQLTPPVAELWRQLQLIRRPTPAPESPPRRPDPAPERQDAIRYDGSSTIGVFDWAARLVETTIATPMQATAMPSHMVPVGGTP